MVPVNGVRKPFSPVDSSNNWILEPRKMKLKKLCRKLLTQQLVNYTTDLMNYDGLTVAGPATARFTGMIGEFFDI